MGWRSGTKLGLVLPLSVCADSEVRVQNADSEVRVQYTDNEVRVRVRERVGVRIRVEVRVKIGVRLRVVVRIWVEGLNSWIDLGLG